MLSTELTFSRLKSFFIALNRHGEYSVAEKHILNLITNFFKIGYKWQLVIQSYTQDYLMTKMKI